MAKLTPLPVKGLKIGRVFAAACPSSHIGVTWKTPHDSNSDTDRTNTFRSLITVSPWVTNSKHSHVTCINAMMYIELTQELVHVWPIGLNLLLDRDSGTTYLSTTYTWFWTCPTGIPPAAEDAPV